MRLPPSGAAMASPDDWANPPVSVRRSSSEGWSDAPGSFDAQSLPLPPHHEEAPLHLPPELPMELPIEPVAVAPVSPIAATLPGGTGLGKPIATASSPLHFTELPRSESGPSHHVLLQGSQPIPRTRQGYANAPAMSRSELYPRFEPQEIDGNISLQPNNRWLYLGLGVVLIGIIVLLAISIAEGPDELPAPARPTQSRAQAGSPGPGASRSDPARVAAASSAAPLKPDAVKPEAFRAEPAAAAAAADGHAAARTAIHMHVVSTPPGAEVSLSGKPLGTTPLDVETDRRVGTEVLTIHRARYQDVTVAVDLARDFDQSVILIPAAEPTTTRPASSDRDRTPAPRPAVRDRPRPVAPSPAKEDCQPPDKINPFENACHGHVCKPCPTTPP